MSNANQPSMKMTAKDYFERHIPHRVNLLVTFRERFEKVPIKEKGYYVRDLFRCSKDSSLLMTRFFLSELGVKLHRKTNKLIPENEDNYLERARTFNLQTLSIPVLESNPKLYNDLVEVLKAANRAVAHIINKDVDHIFNDDPGDEIIFRVIEYLEDKIISNIYKSKNKFARVMKIDDNNMYRERLKLYK
jgi:hypothetical protein